MKNYNNTIIIEFLDVKECSHIFENCDWMASGNYLIILQREKKTVFSLERVKEIIIKKDD